MFWLTPCNPGRAFPGRRPAPAPKYLLPMHGPACERNFWKAQLPARLAAPTNNKGKQTRLREKRRVAEKNSRLRYQCIPRRRRRAPAGQPARSFFVHTISDPRAPRTPSPALSRHQPPRAAAHVSARSAGAFSITARTTARRASDASTDRHAHNTPHEHHSRAQQGQLLCWQFWNALAPLAS